MRKDSHRNASTKVDMLSGNIYRNLLIFALPLIASGVLQQSFNSVDVAVVGHFAGHRALAAVGSNGPVINLIVNLFVGISIGANVVIANYIGRGNKDGIRRAIATTSAIAVASGVILLLVGLAIAEPILKSLGTPDDVIDEATSYLRIYSLGMPFMMAYNFGASILRSMGDTRRPFYALIAGGMVNVVLNLVFVLGFGMGVSGVAIATVVANGVSASIIIHLLKSESDPYRLRPSAMTFARGELAKILRIGVPAGIQGMVFSLSNVFIQSAINSFGSDAMAGSAAALNYESYSYFVISAFAQSVVAFTGQNYGAGNMQRCRTIFKSGMVLSLIASGAINLIVFIFDKASASLFTSDPSVLAYAVTRIDTVLIFQFIASSYEIAGASLRGEGYSMTPTLLTIFGTCVLRLAWVFFVHGADSSFAHLLAIYPVSWVVTGAAMLIAWRIVDRLHRKPALV